MKDDIKLGDKVRDKVSGFEGIVVARSEFINGCVQYLVAKQVKKGENYNKDGDVSIDSYSLEVIKKRVIDSKEYEEEDLLEPTKDSQISRSRTGGPNRFFKRNGY
jgi:hypothetical protein